MGSLNPSLSVTQLGQCPYFELVDTEWSSFWEYPECWSALVLESSHTLVQRYGSPRAGPLPYLQLVGKPSLLIQRLSDPKEWCAEPELLNHDNVWVHTIHWKNACWLTIFTADGSIHHPNCGYCGELKIGHSESLQVSHKYSRHCGELPLGH